MTIPHVVVRYATRYEGRIHWDTLCLPDDYHDKYSSIGKGLYDNLDIGQHWCRSTNNGCGQYEQFWMVPPVPGEVIT